MTPMDKPVDPRRARRKRLLRYAVLGAAALAILFYCWRLDGDAHVKIELDKITLAHVRQDVFQDEIAFIGAVEPIQTVFLDATEGGRVEEIYIREGAAVKKGDAILRLSNDKLQLEISNYETEVARAVNDLKTLRVTLENQLHNNEAELVQYHYDLVKLERDLNNNAQLIKKGVITREAYELGQENCARKQKLMELLTKKSAADKIAFAASIAAAEEMVESMQKNLAVSRARLNTLTIRSPVAGELATLEPELGQVLAYAARIGTINILDSYKVKADVDEHFITRVRPRLKAACEFADKDFPATVSKVYPEVKDGKFSVHLIFSGAVPPGIRIGQTSRVRLELGEPQRALLIPRGAFYAATGGQWIYVVDAKTKTAAKRSLKIGRQNPSCYEVLEGLAPGEEIITSGYEAFGNRDKLILKAGPDKGP